MIVYKHTTLQDVVFYVGIGTKNRAFSLQGRNKFWKRVVNKYGYNVEIILENLTYQEAVDVEKYLIKYYGRRDLKLGTLTNLTDGGEGTLNRIFTKEHKERLTIAQTGNKNHRFGKVGVNKGKLKGDHPASKKIICTKTLRIWNCVKDCSNELNMSYDSLIKKLNGNRENNTNLKYLK